MKLQELMETGMVADEIEYRRTLVDMANDFIEMDELDIPKFTKDDKRITPKMVSMFMDKHMDLENKYGYDAETDSFEEGDEEDFVGEREDLAMKILKPVLKK